MAFGARTLKGAVHQGPLPAASTSKIPATASIAMRLHDRRTSHMGAWHWKSAARARE